MFHPMILLRSSWIWSERSILQRLTLILTGLGSWLLFGMLYSSPVRGATPPSHQPAQTAVTLTGFTHTWQTLNNCGPATLAINLSYFGTNLDQATIAKQVRPNPRDQNVRPDELARYAIEQGYGAILRVNGNADLLRLLISNGLPVIIETWEGDDLNNLMDGFAHFRLVTGYDDAAQRWIVYDPYFQRNLVAGEGYQGSYVDYASADQLWRITNRKYIVIYPPEKTTVVQSILGEQWDDATMWQQALHQAQAESAEQPNDPYAWFNQGSSLYAQGKYEEALAAFQQAQRLGLPRRMLWYQYEPLQALFDTARYDELLQLVNTTLHSATGIEELHYWRGLALAALGDQAEAQQALHRALQIQPHYQQALYAIEAQNAR
jgi:tetratricopeptide (TPR) repeat protein